MRVGLLTESFAPVINGVATSVAVLAQLLRDRGHEPLLVAPRFPGYVDRSELPVLRVPSWRTRYNPDNPFAWLPLGSAGAVLRGVELDVLHSQHPFGLGLLAEREARRRGIRHVSTFHTLYHDYTHYASLFPTWVARAFLSWYLRRFYRSCDAVIVPSAAAGRHLVALGISEARLAVVPTGVPPPDPVTDEDCRTVRARHGIPADAPIALFVGRLAWEKNLKLLLDAFARTRPDARLLLVGGGPNASELERAAAAAGLGARVVFVGPVPRAALAPYYAASTVFAFPSSTETQGIVLSEAQSYGLPCLTVDGGGAPEFVRADIDALVTPSGLEPFSSALNLLLDDAALRERFGDAARRSPLRPTPEAMADRIIALYRAT